jgi:hypothetical protein
MFGIPEVESGATNSSGKGEMKCGDFNTLLVRTPIEIVSSPDCEDSSELTIIHAEHLRECPPSSTKKEGVQFAVVLKEDP